MRIVDAKVKNKAHGMLFGILLVMMLGGCSVSSKPFIKVGSRSFEAGTILSGAAGLPVSFDDMVADLQTVRVVYVGEKHTDAAHHDIQLRIIKALYEGNPDLAVGVEMFARPYQSVLDAWSKGLLDEEAFLKRTHWYANWRYDYGLYRDIFSFIKEKKIPLVALNIPFHLPPKIAVGGIDSLLKEEKIYLPEKIDTTIAPHREYVHEVYQSHRIKGREDFDNFYTAQCVWEDTMAETIAGLHEPSKIVVLAGNGHIYRKFGIPQRAYDRTGRAFRTIYPIDVDGTVQLTDADYLWITPKPAKRIFHRFSRSTSR